MKQTVPGILAGLVAVAPTSGPFGGLLPIAAGRAGLEGAGLRRRLGHSLFGGRLLGHSGLLGGACLEGACLDAAAPGAAARWERPGLGAGLAACEAFFPNRLVPFCVAAVLVPDVVTFFRGFAARLAASGSSCALPMGVFLPP